MKDFLKLIRWKNLLIVILTMVLMRYAIIAPLISKVGVIMRDNPGIEVPMVLQFPWYNFLLLVLATVLLTAGGYVINDYFDIRTDLINKGKAIVGTKISRRKAMMWHNILNLLGVIIGFYISWRAGFTMMGVIFLLVSGLLYFYSASYKRQFLIGNIIVAVLTAMVPMLVVLYEWPALFSYYSVHSIEIPHLNFIFYWVAGFALFAFMTTLTREIIKDVEDFEGDVAYGRNTVPVIIGVLSTRVVSVCMIVVTIFLMYLTWYFFINDIITLIYISATIVVPLLLAIFRLITGTNKKHLHLASGILKLVMLTGILYSVVVKVILTWNLY